MKANDFLLWLAGILAYGAWGALVLLGKTPVDPFVVALASAATGLGTHALKSGTISQDKIMDIVAQVIAAIPTPVVNKTVVAAPPAAAPAKSAAIVPPAAPSAPAASAPAAAPLQ